ncbi:MAG: hypothetical protein V3T01_14360 [Myxococcota bacterium]
MPDRIPLTGADCFLNAFDQETRRFNGASHVSQLVLRLGPGFDVEILRKLVDEVAHRQPMVRARVGRRFGIGPPMYHLKRASRRDLPPIGVFDVQNVERLPGKRDLPRIFVQRLNERRSLRNGELLRFDAIRYAGGAGGTDLAMSWLHLLFDGAGSERFIRWLDECFRGERQPGELPDPRELDPVAGPSRSAGVRGEAARTWQRWHDGFAAHPMHSLAGPRRHTPQALRFDLLTLSSEETERATGEASRRAGFLTPMLFYMAASIRAHDAVHRARGLDPGSYLVPLPVNLRRKGVEGALFRTHVSLLWFQSLPEHVADLDGLIDHLKAQRLAAIKDRQIQNGVDAMDFARFAPRRLYSRLARSSQRGELCSFFFAYTGEFLSGLDRFLGAEIQTAFHVAPVPPSPGSCVAISTRSGRLNLTHVYQRGVFSDPERAIFREALRADLLG